MADELGCARDPRYGLIGVEAEVDGRTVRLHPDDVVLIYAQGTKVDSRGLIYADAEGFGHVITVPLPELEQGGVLTIQVATDAESIAPAGYTKVADGEFRREFWWERQPGEIEPEPKVTLTRAADWAYIARYLPSGVTHS